MNIEFPPIEAWDSSTDCVAFPCDVDGKRIRCQISWEALQDNFDGNGFQSIDAFRSARHRIEEKARGLIKASRFESDGCILIRSADGH